MTACQSDAAPVNESPKLKYWPTLSDDGQAFVAAYVESFYSVNEAAKISGLSPAFCRRMLGRADVRRAIYEVQSELDSIDFLNEKWVKAQILRLMPMVMGEEEVSMINNLGDAYEARKFFPEASIGLLKMVNEMTKGGNGGTDDAPVATSVEIIVEDASRETSEN